MEKFLRNLKTIFVIALVGAVVVVWYAVFYFESRQNLLVTFFDVGQGDAIFIEAPNGNQILIDGGPNDRILGKLGRTLPFWDRSIDLVILTHPEKDHLAGLVDVLRRYDVGTVLWTGVEHSTAEYKEWKQLLEEKSIPVVNAGRGQKVDAGRGVFLEVLAPFENLSGRTASKLNDTSIVMQLHHGSTSMLFTGDISKSTEHRLLFESFRSGDTLDVDILKVGHHGSKTSSIEEFLSAVSPEVSIIQVGGKNRYGHPTQEVLDRLAAVGAQILRNDLAGDIAIESNGKNFWKR